MTAEFRLLGDFEVRADGRLVDVGHARQRYVLASLLTEPNRVVTASQLVDQVWGEGQLPLRPASTLQTYVSLLRRAVRTAGDVTIAWQRPGYKVTVDAEMIDLHRFRSLISLADTARDNTAAGLLAEALGLWRGEPLAGLDTPWAVGLRAALAMQLRAARLDLTDIRLRRGEHAALLADLTVGTRDDPLDERVAGQLMLALYRSGRQADALLHYQSVRRRLTDELGTDPGAQLRDLQQRILTADPLLSVRRGSTVAAGSARLPRPRQLPAPPRMFSGREDEIGRLSALAGSAQVCAISGPGGTGKSWLALHWAHRHLDRFPDGQLWVNLRGFDPSGEPVGPQTALRGFLSALGADPSIVPADPQAQAGLYRSLMADKRMLVVLDNARDTSQIVPLLPGSPGCIALVTSRRQLTGLVAGYGAVAMNLDVLCEGDAWALLARHLGLERMAAEPDTTATLLACCGGLPLAIAVTAARAAAHPELPLSVLATELRDPATRLDALEAGDLPASVRAALASSYNALEPPVAGAFGLLGLVPGPDISVSAAASLTMLPLVRMQAILRDLEAAFLVHQHVPGRYRMHDLVRLYAAEQAACDHAAGARDAALRRVTDFYLHTAFAADRVLAPQRPPARLSKPTAGCAPGQPPDERAALAWLAVEHPVPAGQPATGRRTRLASVRLAARLDAQHLSPAAGAGQ